MANAVCVGELLIDFVPTVTGTDLLSAPTFKKAPGGAPANVAVGLSRLGAQSAFMGKVGDDAFGHFLAKTLSEANVDIGPLRFSDAARTALAFVSLQPDGDREFLFYRHPSADMLFEPADVDGAVIRGAELLHFGSVSLIADPSREATLHAAAIAREAGCRISYDPNLRLALWPDPKTARVGLLDGLARAQLVKMSEEEIEFLTGSRELEGVREALWHDGLELLVITRGAAGCTFLTPTLSGDVPGFAVDAVDATGAGDGFVAGLLYRVLSDSETLGDVSLLRAACLFANATGAIATTERGAIPALPTRSKVEEFLAAHNDVYPS